MKHKSKKYGLKRFAALLLIAVLLATDHTLLYAAESGGQNISSGDEKPGSSTEGNTVSPGDGKDETIKGESKENTGTKETGTEEKGKETGGTTSGGGTTVSGGDGVVSGGDESVSGGDVSGGDVSGGDATVSGGDVSGGDALESRLPESFYEEEKPEDYGELVAYDDYSRTYHVEGNQYVTVIGNDGATYIDDAGNMAPVDNTLREQSSSSSRMARGRSTTGYTNTANDYQVVLPESLSLLEGRGIEITSGGYQMTLYPSEGIFTGGLVKDNAIRYSNVFAGVDYQYTVLGNSLKEDIILLQPTEKNSFSYFVDPSGLKGEVHNNTLYLFEQGTDPETEAVFVLEAPEMTDSAGEMSFGVRLDMEGKGNLLLVTVTADQTWLAAPERVYPVRIDPTAIQVTGSAIRMSCAEEGSPNTVIGDNQYPYVGYDDGITSGNYAGFGSRHLNCRTYFAVDYDFNALLSEAEIVSAAFQVTQKTRWSKGKSEFGLYGVEESWEVGSLNWNNQLNYNHYFLDMQNASTTRGVALRFHVTEEVSAWINGTADNHGFVMKTQVEAPSFEAAQAGVKMQCEVFYNNASANYAPKLILSWTGELTDLDSLTLDDTTIDIYPVVERKGNKCTNTLGVSAHGLAKPGSTVTYKLVNGTTGEVEAQTSLLYPDSALYAGSFPTALSYHRRLSNWQSEVFTNLTPGQVYYVTAQASLDGEEGALATSEPFLIYREGAFDVIPRIALHYGVDVNTIMADMQMQDALTMEGNYLFIRNPQNTAPYIAGELSDYWKALIDGLLLGRAENCEYRFEPININTGNFYMEQEDVRIEDIGGAFAFTRQYNAKGAGYSGSLGYGWNIPFDQRLGELSDGTILWLSGTGMIVPFTQTGTEYSAPSGYAYTLTEEGDSYVLTDQSDVSKYLFNGYGMLTGIEDSKGNLTTLSYDMDYRLSAISSPSGKTYQVSLDAENRIAAISLPDGGRISYEYDSAGNLASVTDGAGDKITYAYDASHRMTAWYDGNGNRVVENIYDTQDRITQQTDAEGGKISLTYAEGSTTAVDAVGNRTVYHYDSQYRTTQIDYPDGSSESRTYQEAGYLESLTDRQGVKYTYTYDAKGHMLTETRQDGAVRSYTYTDSGLLATATEYDGGQTSYTYDEKNRMTGVTDAEGGVIRYGYDEQNRLTSMTDAGGAVTTYTYEGACLTSIKDAEGGVWQYAYDGMNRLIKTTNPLGAVSSQTYNAKGWCIGETDETGNTTSYTFDSAGNVVTITDKEGQTSTIGYDKMNRIVTVSDPLGNTLNHTYDASGNKLTMQDGEGGMTSYTYDMLSRLKTMTDPQGHVTTYIYDRADRITAKTDKLSHTSLTSYDALTGSVVSRTDERGNVTSYAIDVCGRTTQITYADGSTQSYAYDKLGRSVSITDRLGTVTEFTYDAKGNMTSLSDGENRIYTYEYDHLNRLLTSTDPLGGVCRYTYDGMGNLISAIDELGNTTAYEYDSANRLICEVNALGGETLFTYDKEGRLLSLVSPEGRKTLYTYDGIGQLVGLKDGAGNTISYTYDGLSRLRSVTDGAGTLAAYTYNNNSIMVQEIDAMGNAHIYGVDAGGRVLEDLYPNGDKEVYTYLATGEVADYTDRAGVRTSMTYDVMGRVVEAVDTAGNKMTYEYDMAGNLVKQTDVLGRSIVYEYDAYSRVVAITQADGARTEYVYDEMDRLVSVTDPAGNETAYEYDSAGNLLLTTKPGGAVYGYAYDVLNRIHKTTEPEGGAAYFAYDGDGNLTLMTDENGVQVAYAYDALSRLATYTDGNGGQTGYAYDSRSNLTLLTTPEGIRESYTYDGVGNLLSVTNGLGETWQYAYDVLYRLTKETSPLGAEESYLYDRHDVVTSVTDPLGAETLYQANSNGQVVKTVQPNGGIYRYAYDEVGRLTGITTPLGYETTFAYSIGDDLIEESDSLNRTTQYEYDILHNLVSVTNPEGGVTSYTYDERSNRTAMTNGLDFTFDYTYDKADRMVSVADPEEKAVSVLYDMVGNTQSITTPGSRTTSYGYDNNYNITKITDPKGYVYTSAYDKDDRLTYTTDPLGQTTSYGYDAANRLLSYTDKRELTESYTYDAHGNTLTYTDPYGLTTNYVYDQKSRLSEVTNPAGSTAYYTYDVMSNVTGVTDYLGRGTHYTYDLMGNLTSVTDPSGRKEEMGYDAAGRLTSYRANSGSTISYDYDKLNDLIEKTYTEAQGEETATSVTYAYNVLGERIVMHDGTGDTAYSYDGLGRITSVTTNRTPEGEGDTITYLYDEADNLYAMVYPDGSRVGYEYDKNDNLIKVTDREGLETAYVYDAINRITEIHRPGGINTYHTYNEANKITELVNICEDCQWVISRYVYTYDERGFIVAETATESLAGYAYDDKHDGKHEDGRHDDLYPHGSKHAKHDKDATFAYQIVETVRTFTYDDAGKLLGSTENEENYGSYSYEYEYDFMGNLTAIFKKNAKGKVAESRKYLYNESNQLVSVELYDGKKTTTVTYTYDDDGNLIAEEGRDGTDKVELSYTYTVENRLEAVYDGKELLMAAAYDGDGNRVFQLNYNLHTDDDWKGNSGNGNGSNKDNSGSSTVTESTDETITEKQKNNKGNSSANNGKGGNGKNNGNTTTANPGTTSGDTTTTGTTTTGTTTANPGTTSNSTGSGNATNAETNNSQNQSGILFPISSEVSSTEEYLISLIKTSGKEKDYELMEYLNDVNRAYAEVLVEQNINGALDTAYVYGAARLSLDRFDGSSGYYLYDPRGSVTGITNEEGQIYQSYRYNALGDVTFGAPQYENEFTYNGESYNPNIKSQYLRARYYSVVTAAFITEDSYLGNMTNPLTLNRYGYCIGNPLNYVDKNGHWYYEDDVSEIESMYNETPERKKSVLGITSANQAVTFLSALNEVNSPNATVDFVMNFNYERNSGYYKTIIKAAEARNENFACEVFLVTKEHFRILNWEEKGLNQFVVDFNRMLNKYQISNETSIKMFLATLAWESGSGKHVTEDRKNFDDKTYRYNTRGAGYIQLTGSTQISFLEYLITTLPPGSTQSAEVQKLLDNVIEIKMPNDKKAYDNKYNVTDFIASNYALEATGWFWGEYEKARLYYKNGTLEKTPDKNLDEGESISRVSINEYVEVLEGKGNTDNLFLATQYYVNYVHWARNRLQEMSMDETAVPIDLENKKCYFADIYVTLPDHWSDRADFWNIINSQY